MKIKQTEEIQKDKERFVFGAILAICTGFIVNIWSNIIYDSIFSNQYEDLNSPAVSLLILMTIFIQAFFEFYLKDRFKDGPYTKSFWRRFFDFTINDHWMAKMTDKINRVIAFIFKFFLWSLFIISAMQSKAYWMLVVVLIFIVSKHVYKKFKKIK